MSSKKYKHFGVKRLSLTPTKSVLNQALLPSGKEILFPVKAAGQTVKRPRLW